MGLQESCELRMCGDEGEVRLVLEVAWEGGGWLCWLWEDGLVRGRFLCGGWCGGGFGVGAFVQLEAGY